MDTISRKRVSSVRKIGPTRFSVSGVYPFRGETPVQFESTLERDFIRQCEFDPMVSQVIAQPVRIDYTTRSGQLQGYTPDFLVYYKSSERLWTTYRKPVLVEVKPEPRWRANWREWSPKWKAAMSYAWANGWGFHIQDEARIRNKVLQNINFLSRYSRMATVDSEVAAILESVSEMGTATVSYLVARHFSGMYRSKGISLVWHLLATRRLLCDLTQDLDRNTELWINNHE